MSFFIIFIYDPKRFFVNIISYPFVFSIKNEVYNPPC